MDNDLIISKGGIYSKLDRPSTCANCDRIAEWYAEAVDAPVCSVECAEALWAERIEEVDQRSRSS